MAEIIQTIQVEASPELVQLFKEAREAIETLRSEVVELRQHVRWLEDRIEDRL